MSSNLSSSTPSQTQTSFLSSTDSPLHVVSSVSPSMVVSSALGTAPPPSGPLRPLLSPSPFSSQNVLPSPPPTGSSTFSSPLSPPSPIFISSVIPSKQLVDVASSTTSSSTSLGAALSGSPVSSNQGTLRPVEIAAIALGVLTAVLGIAVVLLVFCFRRRRQRHHPLYGLPTSNENRELNNSSRSDAEPRETMSSLSYFRSEYEQKGTSPLLHISGPSSSDLSHDGPYKDSELSDHVLFPVPNYLPQSSWPHEIPPMQNAPSTRPPRSPPPPRFQEKPRPYLSLTIPEFVPPTTRTPTQVDSLSADVNGNMDGDSPSIYSQSSAHVTRGPSVSSHITVRQFSVPSTVLESNTSPMEENVRHDFGAESEDGETNSGETITSATRGPAFFPPPNYDPGLVSQQSHLNRNSGLERQDTKAIVSLLKSRQRQSELLPTAPSSVSHIERAGSIRPAHSVTSEGAGVGWINGENNRIDGREPYGRRYRRMKAEKRNTEINLNAHFY